MSDKNQTLWIFVSIAFVAGLLIGGGAIFLLKGNNASSKISFYPTKSSAAGNNWLAKVDDYAITQEEFEDAFRLYMTQVPESYRASLPPEATLKAEYLNQMISEYAILIKALDSGLLNKKETALQFKAAMRTAISQLYLGQNAPQDPGAFMPTKAEKDAAYQQYKAEFTRRGYTAEQINQVLDQQLVQYKKQEWVARFVQQTKEGFKVQRNEAKINSLGLVPQQPQQAAPFGMPGSTNR